MEYLSLWLFSKAHRRWSSGEEDGGPVLEGGEAFPPGLVGHLLLDLGGPVAEARIRNAEGGAPGRGGYPRGAERTRTRGNTNPYGTEANAAGRSGRACVARAVSVERGGELFFVLSAGVRPGVTLRGLLGSCQKVFFALK